PPVDPLEPAVVPAHAPARHQDPGSGQEGEDEGEGNRGAHGQNRRGGGAVGTSVARSRPTRRYGTVRRTTFHPSAGNRASGARSRAEVIAGVIRPRRGPSGGGRGPPRRGRPPSRRSWRARGC